MPPNLIAALASQESGGQQLAGSLDRATQMVIKDKIRRAGLDLIRKHKQRQQDAGIYGQLPGEIGSRRKASEGITKDDVLEVAHQYGLGPQGITQIAKMVTQSGALDKSVEMETIYGPDNQTKMVPIREGQEYTPPEGWSLNEPEQIGFSDSFQKLRERVLLGEDPNKAFQGVYGETQDPLEVTLTNPKTRATTKARRGSDFYKQMLSQGWQDQEIPSLAGDAGIKGRTGEAIQLLKVMGQPATKQNIKNVMHNIIKPLYGHDAGPKDAEIKQNALQYAARNSMPGDSYQQILERANEFYNYMGGKSGQPGSAYTSPDQVKSAFRSGTLSRDEAVKILKNQFGMQ
jgi:hypothetical protein